MIEILRPGNPWIRKCKSHVRLLGGGYDSTCQIHRKVICFKSKFRIQLSKKIFSTHFSKIVFELNLGQFFTFRPMTDFGLLEKMKGLPKPQDRNFAKNYKYVMKSSSLEVSKTALKCQGSSGYFDIFILIHF